MKTLNPEEFSKADLMRHALRQNIDLSREDASALYGDADFFSSSQFSTIKKEIRAESLEQKQLKLFEKKKEKKEEKAKKTTAERWKEEEKREKKESKKKNGVSIEALQLENAYLRWLLDGERQGFIDRWLEERNDE
jgi:hypothetical protein